MDPKSLELLEFPKVRELLAAFTSFSASRELALEIEPLTGLDRIQLLLNESAEARRLLEENPGVSLGQITDIRETVRMAGLGKVLEPADLITVQSVLAASRAFRRSLSRSADACPRLWDIAAGITEMPELEKEIGKCVTPNGEVPDSASEKLGDIRRRLRKTRDHLLGRLDATLKSSRGRKIVQEPIITEREGRYVIPVKVENRKDIRGIVHDMSNTGATIFIEPWATMELGNELRQLSSEEKYEVERVLHAVSLKIAARETEITRNIIVIARLDLILAKARFAFRSRAVEPIVTGPENGSSGVLALVNARHPLLGEKAVPLTVEIGRDFSTLVITGPNMGGKTVALKTVGLLSAMALAGLPIPASGESRIPAFDGVFADIGDEQSIEETVSTFSWHVGNIVRIIKDSSPVSLVLLDELGASTDPAEGSALARSILVHLQSRNTMTVATSHYDDLKAFAHTTRGFRNASLDLDPLTHMPTYHLTVGIPGGSNALAVAEHLGLPPEIIDRAREMMGRGTLDLEALLSDLGGEKARLAAARQQIEGQQASLASRESIVQTRERQLAIDERRLIEQTRDTVVREASELQREIRLASAELQKTEGRQKIDVAKRALASVQEKLKADAWKARPAPETEPAGVQAPDTIIRPGDAVLIREAGVRATVLSVSPNGQAEVHAGNARLTLSVAGLEKVTTAQSARKPAPATLTKQVTPPASMQLDLHGKRAGEVEPELDSFLNKASATGLGEIRIIHGMATGAVRKIVREFLSSHPLVRTFRPGDKGEGGDGATVVKL